MQLNKIDAIFAKYDKPGQPGCAIAVLKHGRAIYQRGFGSKRLGIHDPITPRTTFNIGSVSKQFTAFCLLLLQDEGKLSLEDSVRKHLPELPKRLAAIKLRHLMHHSSGMPSLEDLLWSQWKVRKDRPDGPDMVRLMARQPLMNFEPGGEFCYCNSGYTLMAEVIRRRSGLDLRKFAQERIFGPLGMRNTRVLRSHATYVPEKAEGYRKVKGKIVVAPKEFFTLGSGDIWTNFEDLAKWERNFFERKIGSPAAFAAMFRRARYKRTLPGDNDYAGGLEFFKDRGRQFVGHTGGDSGALTEYFRLPELGLAVIFATNGEHVGGGYAQRVFEALLGWKPRRPTLRPRALPKAYRSAAGVYENDRALWHARMKARSMELELRGVKRELLYIGQGNFMAADDPDNRFKLSQEVDGAWSLRVFTKGKLRRQLQHLGRASKRIPGMHELAGTYCHPASGYVHQLKVIGKQLYFVDPHWVADFKTPMSSLGPDLLVNGGLAFVVERAGKGKVKAMIEWEPDGRHKQLRMVKLKERR